jgi:hypothetical protein
MTTQERDSQGQCLRPTGSMWHPDNRRQSRTAQGQHAGISILLGKVGSDCGELARAEQSRPGMRLYRLAAVQSPRR